MFVQLLSSYKSGKNSVSIDVRGWCSKVMLKIQLSGKFGLLKLVGCVFSIQVQTQVLGQFLFFFEKKDPSSAHIRKKHVHLF